MQVYSIGHLTLQPHRELLDGNAPVVIGRRALDVLSVLAEAGGELVCKDELLKGVWHDTIVEENALQAQISAARKALGSEAERLITVHGRGYRLLLDGASTEHANAVAADLPESDVLASPRRSDIGTPPSSTPRPRSWTRRAAVAGVVGGAGALAGLALWPRSDRHHPDPRALELYRRGRILEQAGDFPPGVKPQARILYEQAVRIDPDFADAWAALALCHRDAQLGWVAPFGDPGVVGAAARRALALDPGNPDAQLALILLYPNYRRWLSQEARLRAFLARHPDHDSGHIALASVLADVGRCENAVVEARRATEIDPTTARGWWALGTALSLAGDHVAAGLALADGLDRWPQHRGLWARRYWTFLESRRLAEAAAFARDRSRRPAGVPDDIARSMAQIADDLASREGIARQVEAMRQATVRSQISVFLVLAPLMVQLGMVDDVFDMLAALFFGGTVRGTRIPPPGLLDPRLTAVLFTPDVLTLREDPRFGRLLQRTGLEDYWRKSGTRPDFRGG